MLRRPRTGLDVRLLVALVLLALVLTIWQHRARASTRAGSTNLSVPERMAAAVAWPLQRLFALSNGSLEGVGVGLGQYRRLVEENKRLRAEKEELATQKLRLTEAYAENQYLRKKLGYSPTADRQPLVAKVIGTYSGLSLKRLTIMGPPGRELEVGNIVRTHAGLIGRITDVNGRRGYVFPLIDASHAVAGIVQRSRDHGMVRVAAQPDYQPDALVMDKLLGRADIRAGDVILTSGLGEVYPSGIPIGDVVAVRRSSTGSMDVTAIIRPRVDFDRLEYVLVERHGQ